MFIINIYLRFAIMAACFIGGIALAATISVGYSIPFFLIGIILLVGYVLLGTVMSAAQIVQTQDFAAAEKRLNLTLKPEWLYSANRSYYYMMHGTIAMQKKDLDGAEVWLKKAEEVKVPTANEQAMVYLQLANIAATKNRWPQAQMYMAKLKGLKITEPMIKEQVAMMEKGLANRGQVQMANRMGVSTAQMSVVNPKTKRRRPKMR